MRVILSCVPPHLLVIDGDDYYHDDDYDENDEQYDDDYDEDDD